jgi:hypothetical protein
MSTPKGGHYFYLEIAWHFGGKCFRKLDNGVMQVYGGCVLE